jgi:ATP-dependent RNA helicase SUPV3L1/SUV3
LAISINETSYKNKKEFMTKKLPNNKTNKKIEPIVNTLNIAKIIKLVKHAQAHGFSYKNDKWYRFINLNIDNYQIKQLVEIKLKHDLELEVNEDDLLKDLTEATFDQTHEENKLIARIEKYELTPEVREKMLVHLSDYTQKISEIDFTTHTVVKTMESHLAVFLQIRQKQKIINDLKIEQYETGYPIARSLDRDIKIIVGPTNSGKTYEALQHLMKAQSGAYLAPLRLLAMEIYDKLNAAGVPCNLITGEERVIVPGAKHTSSTIEMMNGEHNVEVAIIDEFQMLDDPQRGWAWTSAMVGVPAKTVYVIGNEQKLDIATKLYKHLGETYEVIRKERFNKLLLIDKPVDLGALQKGDALIAFSRKDILSYATVLRKRKYKVSIIYGALSPEVRRKQADLFNSGQTDIVISTDAIGMGLNLPIKRIIFATISKYDGKIVRQLQTSELLQIAGRAGRYGLHEEGFVGLLNNKVNDFNTVKKLKNMLGSGVGVSHKKMQVAPTDWHINIISEILKTKDLGKILLCFTSLRYNSIYETANLEQMVLLYGYVKYTLKDLPLKEQYHLITAPVELHNTELVEYYQYLVKDIVEKKQVAFITDNYYDLESAEIENKKLTIFAWLSFYYPNLDPDNINEERNLLSDFIQKRLKHENNYGFSKMIEPKYNY